MAPEAQQHIIKGRLLDSHQKTTAVGYALNKQNFRDAIYIRYGWKIDGTPNHCACGETNSVDHSLKLGGYTPMRHNSVRDSEAQICLYYSLANCAFIVSGVHFLQVFCCFSELIIVLHRTACLVCFYKLILVVHCQERNIFSEFSTGSISRQILTLDILTAMHDAHGTFQWLFRQNHLLS